MRTGNIITAPVMVQDIKEVLDVQSNDVATLCSSNKVNGWARHRPYSINFLRRTVSTTPAYVGDRNPIPIGSGLTTASDFGISVSSITWTQLANMSAYSQWTYSTPTGTETRPYFLGDFEGYNHDAAPPLYFPGITINYWLEILSGNQIIIGQAPSTPNVTVAGQSVSSNLTFQDIKDLGLFQSSWYFGYMLRYTDSSNTLTRLFFNVGDISTTTLLADITLPSNVSTNNQNVYVVPFITDYNFEQSSSTPSIGTVYTLPARNGASYQTYIYNGTAIQGEVYVNTTQYLGGTKLVDLEGNSSKQFLASFFKLKDFFTGATSLPLTSGMRLNVVSTGTYYDPNTMQTDYNATYVSDRSITYTPSGGIDKVGTRFPSTGYDWFEFNTTMINALHSGYYLEFILELADNGYLNNNRHVFYLETIYIKY